MHIFTLCVYDVIVGKSWNDKVKEVREKMTKKKADALVVTALDEIACKHRKQLFIGPFIRGKIRRVLHKTRPK